jgi:predicted RNase H-like nuclease (RuvC/YqgF family)
MATSSSDYAALMREVRNSEGMKLEIHRLKAELKDTKELLAQTDAEATALRAALQERDTIIEELRSAGSARGGVEERIKQRDDTIARLQAALQAKHRELEDLKAKSGGMFRKK